MFLKKAFKGYLVFQINGTGALDLSRNRTSVYFTHWKYESITELR
nr:MAG TPA: hypothetical protein [Caudoviricetes sp.]